MKKLSWSTCALTGAASLVFALSGCGKAGAGSASTQLSGTLGSTQAFSEVANFTLRYLDPVERLSLETAVAGLKCTTAANPPVTVAGTVAATGSFSIDLSSVQGIPLTCNLLDASGNVLGTFVFADSNAASLAGGALQMDTVAFTGDKAVGTVTISGGTVTVDAVSADIPVTGATVTAAQAFDPTGIWTISAPSFTLPPGYVAPCAQNDNSCHGPSSGMTLYLKRLDGLVFTPDATCADVVKNNTFSGTCNGTTGTQAAFGLTIWNSQAAENACGNGTTPALGATNVEAEAFAQIDFSQNSSILTEALQFSTSLGGHTIANGWEDQTAATSNWAMQDCHNVVLSDGTTNAWKCFDANGNYSIGVGGGCTDASGNPVNVQQNLGSPLNGTCSNQNVTVAGLSLQSNSCQFHYTPQGGSQETITCGGEFGTFNANGTAFTNVNTTGTLNNSSTSVTVASGSGISNGMSVFDMNGNCLPNNGQLTVANISGTTVTLSAAATCTQASANLSFGFGATQYVTQGGSCSSINTSGGTDDAAVLAQEECYSNYYYQSLQNSQTGCIKHIQTNWGASTSASFLQKSNGPDQAVTEQVLEKLIYFDDNHAAMTQVQDDYPGVSAGGNSNSFTPCHVIRTASIKITNESGHAVPVTGDTMLISYVQETHLADDALTNSVCVADAAAGDNNTSGVERMLFVMTHN